MKNKLLIIGASGHGKVVADTAFKMNKWNEIAFLDDKNIQIVMGLKIVGKSSDLNKFIDNYDIFVGIGDNKIRQKFHEILEINGANIPTLIHPTAVIGEQVTIKPGTIVMANVVINCCTYIGKGCIVNTAATIDHDNLIDNYVHVSPGVNLAGSVKIGQCSWIGIGTAISNNVNITNNCSIGAGAVVIKDVTEPGTYVGVPARRM